MLALANEAFNAERHLPAPPAAPHAPEAAEAGAAAARAEGSGPASAGVPLLQALCADVLVHAVIDEDNAVGLLQIADSMGLPGLSARCSDFICANLSRVREGYNFAALPADLQQALLMCAARVENPAGSTSTAYHSPSEFLAIVDEYYDVVSGRLREAAEDLRQRRGLDARSLGDSGSAGLLVHVPPSSDPALAYAEGKIAEQRVRVEAVRRYRDKQRALFAALQRQRDTARGLSPETETNMPTNDK